MCPNKSHVALDLVFIPRLSYCDRFTMSCCLSVDQSSDVMAELPVVAVESSDVTAELPGVAAESSDVTADVA